MWKHIVAFLAYTVFIGRKYILDSIFIAFATKSSFVRDFTEGRELNASTISIPLQSDQSLSRVWLFETPWTAARQASRSITNSQSLLTLMFIESVMSSNHLILCHPLFLLPSIFPNIRIFSSEWVLHIRWPKDWSFSISLSPSNEHSGLISFRIVWFVLLAVQGTLKSLLQHCSSKAPSLWSNSYICTRLLENP